MIVLGGVAERGAPVLPSFLSQSRHYRCFVLRGLSPFFFFLAAERRRTKTRTRRRERSLSRTHGSPSRAYGTTNFPPSAATRPFFLRSLPSQEATRTGTPLEPRREAHRRFKVATVLAGKLFDRLPLNHSSRTPALLSSVLPPPVATVSGLCRPLSLSLSPSSPPLRWPRARASSFQSPSVSTLDRCVTRPGKITMDIITRGRAGERARERSRARAREQCTRGCCCKLGFYYGNSHAHSGQRL